MIKKVSIIITILILCGACSRIFNDEVDLKNELNKTLTNLGYSEESINIIENFKKENQDLFIKEYSAELEELINTDGIKEEDINLFLDYKLDVETYCYLKNNNILTSDNIALLKTFKKDKYFILNNLKQYIQYKDLYNTTRLVIEYVNTKAYLKPYIQYRMSDVTKGIYMIASKIYYLYQYVPTNIVDVEDNYKTLSSSPKMVKEAYDAFKKMSDAGSKEELKIKIASGYRSYDHQKIIYEDYLKKDPQSLVDTYSSRPGFSDHQIGLSCDIWANNETFEGFSFTKESAWLKENAYKYGFILRYPNSKDYITGYMYESWHYRYVGLEAAKEIHDNNITFDEYYAYYIENN